MPRYAFCLLPVLLALTGCSDGPPPPPETDPAKGRETLKTVLDIWQNGGKPADAKPVVVADPDWEEGAKLTRYEVEPTDGRAGVDLLLKVKLSLQKGGSTQTKAVNFVVGIGPQTVVLRYQ